jgi:hypothetical protein
MRIPGNDRSRVLDQLIPGSSADEDAIFSSCQLHSSAPIGNACRQRQTRRRRSGRREMAAA